MKTVTFYTLDNEIENPAYDGRSAKSFKLMKMIPEGTVIVHEVIPASKGDLYDFERTEWKTVGGTVLKKEVIASAKKSPHTPTEYEKVKAVNPHDMCWTLEELLKQGVVTAEQCQMAQDNSID